MSIMCLYKSSGVKMHVKSITRVAVCAAMAIITLPVLWGPGASALEPQAASVLPAGTIETLDASGQPLLILPDGADLRTTILVPGEFPVAFDEALALPVEVVEPPTETDGGLRANQCYNIGSGPNTFGSNRAWHGNIVGVGPDHVGKKLMQTRVVLSSATTQTLNLTFTVYRLDRAQNKYVPIAVKPVNSVQITSTPTSFSSGDYNNGSGIGLQVDHDGNQTLEGRYAIGIGWSTSAAIVFRRNNADATFPFGTLVGYWGLGQAPPTPATAAPISLSAIGTTSLYMDFCIQAPPGACCLPNDTCQSVLDRAFCESIGGQFTSANVLCADISCPLPQGACCIGNSCDYTNEFECLDPQQLNGESWEAERDCFPFNPCGPVRGACCRVNGHCDDDIAQADCETDAGVWHGAGSACNQPSVFQACSARGACCLPGGGCQLVIPSGCNSAQGQVYRGDGTRCPGPGQPLDVCNLTLGACCQYDGTCLAGVTQYECSNNSPSHTPGVWYGSSTCQAAQCPAYGACCSGPNFCEDKIETDCYGCRDPIGQNPVTCPAGYQIDTNGICPDANTNGSCILTARKWHEGQPCEYGPCRDDGHVGRCCLLGDCEILNSVDCAAAGGIYTDMGTNGFAACTSNGGPADCSSSGNVGACCNDTTCSLKSEADCASSGGLFSTNGVGCSMASCADRTCCDAFFTCSTSSGPECEASGGIPGDPGTHCPSGGLNPCEPSGGCCLPDGSCAEANQSTCINSNGTYLGDNMPCAANVCPGACCHGAASATCSFVTPTECAAFGQATFLGTAVECSLTACDRGGCCHLDGSCADNVPRAECEALPGADFLGTGTACTPGNCVPRGACCESDICTLRTEADCNTNGGTYLGDGEVCDTATCAIVPCCVGASDCKDIYNFDCANSGGFSGEIGDACTIGFCTPGACCVGSPIAVCKELNQIQCASSNGVFEGTATSCAPNSCTAAVGACCLAAGQAACVNGVTEADCISTNGTFKGVGSQCGPDLCVEQGVCCLGGTCQDNGGALYTAQQCQPCGTFFTSNTCASVTCSPKLTCVDADVNCDGAVNGSDILSVRAPGVWNTAAGPTVRADVNNDGQVNGSDILSVRAPGAWNTCMGPCNCPP